MSDSPPVTVTVFVDDPQKPSPVALTAVSRVRAAASRMGAVTVEVLGLSTDEAIMAGAAIEPTVVVGDLVIATGQAPAAGHVIRAIEAVRGETL